MSAGEDFRPCAVASRSAHALEKRKEIVMGASTVELPRWECLELIEAQEVGRVCIVEHGYPLAFPVTYRVVCDGDAASIVFRTDPKAAIGRYRGAASMEVDEVDRARRNAWSVIVRGTLRRSAPHQHLLEPVPLVTERRHQWMVLDISSISGRRFVSKPVTGGFDVEWQFAEP
jgi:nitroimidazol reductase NimA-like FMN-containing flavoprotein (pyridoxamine 5'-phosphate oxidase superfamily)